MNTLPRGEGRGARWAGIRWAAACAAGRGDTLRRRAAFGAAWVMLGHGVSQVLRLGSNLVLTRLLFPEAFGLIALVQVVMHGIQMFSDVGLRANIIQNKRGADRSFLNTAWTIQIARGWVIWLACVALAWPFAVFYGAHELALLLPVSGMAAIMVGFESTNLATAEREIRVARVTAMEIATQCLSIATMIVWALVSPTVWAFVAGGLVRAMSKMIATHVLLPGGHNRLGWDRAAAGEMFRFGRWIFLSTLLTFLLQQGDKAILGRLIEPEVLGVYAIAVLWGRMALDVGLKLGGRVVFPALAEVANQSRHLLRSRYLRARLVFLGLLLPATWGLALFGDALVDLLYDPRYADAGWMIRLLAPGFAAAVISGMSGSVQLAVGDSFRQMVVQVSRGALLVAGVAAGWSLGGLPGLLVGMSLSKVVDYPVIAWGLRRHGVWLPGIDLGAYAATALVVGGGWFLFPPSVPW